MLGCREKSAEIGIGRNENAVVRSRAGEHCFVARRLHVQIADMNGVVAVQSKLFRNERR